MFHDRRDFFALSGLLGAVWTVMFLKKPYLGNVL